jgi:hypothetical protein
MKNIAFSLLSFFSLGMAAMAGGTISVADYGARANDGSDTTPAVRQALEECRKTGAAKLTFPPGRYDFWPDRAEEKFYFITNNDSGLRAIEFPLTEVNGLEIDGGGAEFVFHDKIMPFVLDHSTNVTLRNFSIDWARTFQSEVKVLSVDDSGLEATIPEQFPYKIDKGSLVFLDELKKPLPTRGILEFDPKKRETAFLVKDYFRDVCLRAHADGPGRVHIDEKIKATPGNVLVITPDFRLYPAITISDAGQTQIIDVTIHHAGGMGVVAQRSRDITLERVRVTPPADGKRVCSLTADATHFSNCSGQIVMDHCLFENQMDDATNIHGIYSRIDHRLGPDSVEVELVHPQQWGFDYLAAGERIEFVNAKSLVTYGEAMVKSATRLNERFTNIVLDGTLPEKLQMGDVVALAGPYPDVRISHCDIGRNRARGLLLGSRGKIVIEDNVFHTAGAAILMEGNPSFWFEQAGVRDLTIRRNRFENCNYGTWGNAVIQVGAGIDPSQRAVSRYNRNILIEDNVFRVFDPRLINVYCVDGLTFTHNRVEHSTDYPAQYQDAKPFEISDCDHVRIDEAPGDAGAAGPGR